MGKLHRARAAGWCAPAAAGMDGEAARACAATCGRTGSPVAAVSLSVAAAVACASVIFRVASTSARACGFVTSAGHGGLESA